MASDDLSSVNILVIEDDIFVQKVISRVLENIGVASVEVVGTGQEGLDHLGQAGSSIDVIICDVEMPGMNGFDFSHRVRQSDMRKYKEVPILMLTARDTDENVKRGQVYKIDAFLVKPPTEDMLRTNIIRALGSSPIW